MTHWTRIALASAVSFGFLTPGALASPGPDHDDESEAEKAPAGVGDDDGDRGKPGKPGGKGGKAGKGDGPVKIGPFPKDKYPKIFRYRPLTLSKSMTEVELGLDYVVLPDFDPIEVPDLVFAGLDLAYGLAPTVEFHIGTALLLAPDVDWSNSLVLGAKYLAHDTAKFDLAVGLDLGLQLQDGGQTSVSFLVPMRYLAGDVWDIHGAVVVPIFVDPDFFINVGVAPGVGLQASNSVYLSLDTTILTISSAEGGTTHLGDALPIDFRLNYAIDRQWDIGAHLGVPIIWAAEKQAVGIGIFGRGRF